MVWVVRVNRTHSVARFVFGLGRACEPDMVHDMAGVETVGHVHYICTHRNLFRSYVLEILVHIPYNVGRFSGLSH